MHRSVQVEMITGVLERLTIYLPSSSSGRVLGGYGLVGCVTN